MKRLLPTFLLIACGTPAPIVDAGPGDVTYHDAPFPDAAAPIAMRRPHTPAPLTRLNQIIVFREGGDEVYGASHYTYEGEFVARYVIPVSEPRAPWPDTGAIPLVADAYTYSGDYDPRTHQFLPPRPANPRASTRTGENTFTLEFASSSAAPAIRQVPIADYVAGLSPGRRIYKSPTPSSVPNFLIATPSIFPHERVTLSPDGTLLVDVLRYDTELIETRTGRVVTATPRDPRLHGVDVYEIDIDSGEVVGRGERASSISGSDEWAYVQGPRGERYWMGDALYRALPNGTVEEVSLEAASCDTDRPRSSVATIGPDGHILRGTCLYSPDGALLHDFGSDSPGFLIGVMFADPAVRY